MDTRALRRLACRLLSPRSMLLGNTLRSHALPFARRVYRFDEFTLDLPAWELRQHARAIELPPKCVLLLAYLIEHRDRVVTRDELFDVLWHDVLVAGGSLTQAVWTIRQALGADSARSAIIKTFRGRGYRFLAPVELLSTDPTLADLSAGLLSVQQSDALGGASVFRQDSA
jgi:DNA-binding winged helix-turn-helix (wHTH) protein